MSEVREQAYKLRMQGWSYNEINKKLGIPKSTLSNWFSRVILSDKAQARIRSRVRDGIHNGLIQRNRMQTVHAQRRAKDTRARAQEEVDVLCKDSLWLAGVMLYWAEGYKRPIVRYGKEKTAHSISFTNSDPQMVKLFIRFLVEKMDVLREDLVMNLRIFDPRKESAALTYWCQITNVEPASFKKVSFVVSRASKGKRPWNQLPNGTIQVRVYDTEKFHRLMGWIEGVVNKF